jgi:hypothetical protein
MSANFNYFTFASELSVIKTDQNFFVFKAGTRRRFLVLLLLSLVGPGGAHPPQCQTGQLTDNGREEVQDVVFVLPVLSGDMCRDTFRVHRVPPVYPFVTLITEKNTL